MTPEKERLLEDTYIDFVKVAMGQVPVSDFLHCIDDRFMGYGTAPDERIFGKDGFQWMMERQWESIEPQDTELIRTRIYKEFFDAEDAALIVEEIDIKIPDGDINHVVQMRFSALFRFGNSKWKLLHFHTSMPDNNTPDDSSWPIEEWQRRNGELQNIIAEKTQDLVKINQELKIDASLEKIQGLMMSMQNSNDLSELVGFLFLEISKLDIIPTPCGLVVFDAEDLSSNWWLPNIKDPLYPHNFTVKYHNHKPYLTMVQAWKDQTKNWIYEHGGEEKKKWDEFLFTETGFSKLPENIISGLKAPSKVYFSGSFFRFGCLQTPSLEPLTTFQMEVLNRYGKIFDMSLTRFKDLKQAEALARSEIQKASLDRVRGEIASMRKPKDLKRITPLIWNELTILGVPFIRCGVFIMDDNKKLMHTYLNTPDGKDIAAIHLPYTGTKLVENAVKYWKDQKIYQEHWDKKNFQNWMNQLIEKGHIPSAESYRSGEEPENLYLNFIPFTQGMLYVGSPKELDTQSLDLIRSLAVAFANAYARYEDFTKLKSNKEKVEKSLAELQNAKDQLVQQEKLASLGQLTAGIAHEIKNPLNFVINFSDLSQDLLNEAIEGLKAENLSENKDDLLELLEDVKSNLSKIQQHGTRADRIVKSMLQHSNGGSRRISPVDLNALVKEFVNLSFHGMRAGKNPINVTIQEEYDDAVGEVDLISEDFSRVILNLCNNAFDAMRDKLNSAILNPIPSSYQPKLSVRTIRNKNGITLEIEDNGTGIPDELKSKVLQPFFTTKKGTEGTGLGLSITNDIIKAHGGVLEIESQENAFSRFVIQLP